MYMLYVHVSVIGQCWAPPQLHSTLAFETESLPDLEFVDSVSLACLYLPSTESTGMCYQPSFWLGSWGFELRSPDLHCKYFTHWAISPVPDSYFCFVLFVSQDKDSLCSSGCPELNLLTRLASNPEIHLPLLGLKVCTTTTQLPDSYF